MAEQPGDTQRDEPTVGQAGHPPADAARGTAAPQASVSGAIEQATPWGQSRGRRIWVRVLLVLALILGVLSIFAVWSRQQLLNTDQWTKTSSQLLQNQAIRDEVGTYLTDQLYSNVDVQAQLQARLPPQLAPLAPAASAGLRNLVNEAADKALATPKVQAVWADANRQAHTVFVKIIDGGGANVSTQNGVVTLNLQHVLGEVAARIGLPGTLVAKIPASAASIQIMRSDQLEQAQNAAKLLKALAFVLGPLALLTLAAAVYLARGHRRQTLLSAGLAAIGAGLIVLIARTVAGNQINDALAQEAAVKPAANAAWEIATELLKTLAWQAIIIGLGLALASWIAGPSRPATAVRRWLAPLLRDHQEVAYAVLGAVLLLLIAWSPTPGFKRPIFILVLIIAAPFGLWTLRRQALAEFPAEPPGAQPASG